MSIGTRLKRSWNAFFNKDPTPYVPKDEGSSYSYRPDRVRFTFGNERSTITQVYNRIAVDCAAIDIQHIKLDDQKRFNGVMDSKLNDALTVSANIDQTGRALIQDIVMTMLDQGDVCVVPYDINGNADIWHATSFDVIEMRVARIITWHPQSVDVEIYSPISGQKERMNYLPKRNVAIIANPFYSIMNEPSATIRRLTRKLSLLDMTDDQNASGKLDLIIQLPYTIKTPNKRAQAEARRKDIEMQLSGSKYGIAYTDGTEKVVQLNRSIENNLQKQVEYWQELVYSQLGITQSILDSTADEKTFQNYYSRTVEPIVQAIVDEFKRKFLSQTARTQGQSIQFFRDPFKLIPASQLPDMVDKFKRNAVMTSNEWRQILRMMPSDNPDADRLENPNISKSKEQLAMQYGEDGGMDPSQFLESVPTQTGTPSETVGGSAPAPEDALEAFLSGFENVNPDEMTDEVKDKLAEYLDELEKKLSEVT